MVDARIERLRARWREEAILVDAASEFAEWDESQPPRADAGAPEIWPVVEP